MYPNSLRFTIFSKIFTNIIQCLIYKYMCHMRSSNIYILKKRIIILLPTINSISPSPHPRPQLTHTHTHTRARARTHARKHARTHARTHTHTHTHEYETGSGWYVQISQKAWRNKCVFRLTLKVGREGAALRSAGSR